MARAGVNGVELEYEVSGSGEPLLLINPVLADGFTPILREPALRGYRLITYHKRGWRGSTHTPPPVTIADHAADAAALLEELGGRAHVVGHSSGGSVGAQLALDAPDFVHTLALLEPTFFSAAGADALLAKAGPALEAYAAGDHETAFTGFMCAVSGLEWGACRRAIENRNPGAVSRALEDIDTLFGVELPAVGAWTFGASQAAAISQPVLSVRGSDTEPLWIEIARLLRSWLPHAEESIIAGARHLLHMERPGAVAESLAAFLARNPMTQSAAAARASVARA
jgi:pimeloyl-ACP methyl ester carboxylesterase